MKTIRQIREDYNNKFFKQMAKSSENVVLEGRGSVINKAKETRTVPLPNQMPTMLLFSRVAYRLYPNKQVVALYYSKTVDKYLSVPFGPDGNLNLSESAIYNTYDDVLLAEGAKWQAVKGGLKGAAQGALKGAALGSMVGHAPGTTAGAVVGTAIGAYKGAKKAYNKDKSVNERFQERLRDIREQELNENPLLRSLGGWALNKALNLFKDSKKKEKESPISSATEKTSSEYIRQRPEKPGSSSWKRASSPDAVFQSRVKAATQKDIDSISKQKVAENRISDIKNMINEGHETYDISINGRTVTLNTSMAKRILEVYDSVNSKNKKIVENMLNEDLESFKKLLNFSIKA